jgi:soluble lytic murein transglycosylase
MVMFVALFLLLGEKKANAQNELSLTEQRQLYDRAQRWLDDKQVTKYRQVRHQLVDYPLTPYLDYRVLLIDIGDKSPQTVQQFIDTHQTFPFSNRIRAPYLQALAKKQKWQTLLAFQKAEPNQEQYRCYYYSALLHTGEKRAAFQGAESLWLSGNSISDACDPLFSEWHQYRGFTDRLVIARMLLAFEQRNYSLMKYLKKKLKSQKQHAFAENILDMYLHPERTVKRYLMHRSSDHNTSKLIGLGLKKLAATSPLKAYALISQRKQLTTDAEKYTDFFQYLAKKLLDETDPEISAWRDKVIVESQKVSLIEQRIRQEIRMGNWQGIYDWISRLPEAARKTPRWQFWLGRSALELGKKETGMALLNHLAGRRNFYGVAAANYLRRSIDYPEISMAYTPALIREYQPALTRIQELIDRRKLAASKSEWYWLLRRATMTQKTMLAHYASAAHWYHLTVVAAIRARLWDHLELRFPKAYFEYFKQFGSKYHIDPITLMSLARQESAMDTVAQSPVGAKGIMQVLPSTAKYVANKYQLSYRSARDLFDVKKNIEVGSQYLNELLKRFEGNRILAFAAYNAGPTRVDKWLENTDGDLDAYQFIESIPFGETRGYVQNVLMFETYYRHLMDLQGQFLTNVELSTTY